MKKVLGLVVLLLSAIQCIAAPVNVNTADAKTIAASLHGVGEKKAQEIVADRNKNGAFSSLEDLGRVKGIGDKTLAKNKADILFSGEGKSVAAPKTKAKAPNTPPAKSKPAKASSDSNVANPLK